MHTHESEREKYARMWGVDAYRERSPGLRVLLSAYTWIKPARGASFTDWGCGTGVVGEALAKQGHPVTLVDIAQNAYRGSLPFVVASLWDLPESLEATDHGYCADVMEHVPPEHVDATIEQIAKRTRVSAFFQIALFEDHFGEQIGETLHLSVFPPAWWRVRLVEHFPAGGEFRVADKRLEAVMKR